MAQLYEEVTLARDVPEYNLKQGDSAILVDIVAHPKGKQLTKIAVMSVSIGVSFLITPSIG